MDSNSNTTEVAPANTPVNIPNPTAFAANINSVEADTTLVDTAETNEAKKANTAMAKTAGVVRAKRSTTGARRAHGTLKVAKPGPPKHGSPQYFKAIFSDSAIRRGFIRKVYLILTAQLLFTVAVVSVCVFVKPVTEWAATDTGWYCYIASMITFFVVYIAMICCKKLRRKTPGNYICLSIFTMSFSFMAGMISSFYDSKIVMMAMGITALVCLSITLFVFQTKIDFNLLSGFIFVLIVVIFFFGWSSLAWYYTWGSSEILNLLYGALIALVFGLILVFDTMRVVKNGRHALSPEEYIYAALELYVDVIYIFLIILSFFRGGTK